MTMNILEQITEEQVMDWMKAKLESVMEGGLPATNLEIQANHFSECDPGNSICLHAEGQCVVSCKTIDEAISQLTGKIGDPAKRAAAKREEAGKLLREAAELEAGK